MFQQVCSPANIRSPTLISGMRSVMGRRSQRAQLEPLRCGERPPRSSASCGVENSACIAPLGSIKKVAAGDRRCSRRPAATEPRSTPTRAPRRRDVVPCQCADELEAEESTWRAVRRVALGIDRHERDPRCESSKSCKRFSMREVSVAGRTSGQFVKPKNSNVSDSSARSCRRLPCDRRGRCP